MTMGCVFIGSEGDWCHSPTVRRTRPGRRGRRGPSAARWTRASGECHVKQTEVGRTRVSICFFSQLESVTESNELIGSIGSDDLVHLTWHLQVCHDGRVHAREAVGAVDTHDVLGALPLCRHAVGQQQVPAIQIDWSRFLQFASLHYASTWLKLKIGEMSPLEFFDGQLNCTWVSVFSNVL